MRPLEKKKALRRLRIIKGQILGLEKMVQDERYCVDIITQSSAARKALLGVEDIILEHHLSTHVVMQMKSGESKKATEEVLKIYRLSNRK